MNTDYSKLNNVLLQLFSLTRVLLHVQTPIQVLKIDVEGYEWRVLREMLNTADLEATRNLAVEFHLAVSGFVSFGILDKWRY